MTMQRSSKLQSDSPGTDQPGGTSTNALDYEQANLG